MAHRNMVTIKVDLGTMKVLVEALVHPDDGEI
jgi:hypothetical protein